MNTYTYYDNSQQTWELYADGHGHYVSPVVLQCQAENILEADKIYLKTTGHDVTKQRNISLYIH